MGANVKPWSLLCKPKEFPLVSEGKMSLNLQHCQTFLIAHANATSWNDIKHEYTVRHQSKNKNQNLAIEQIL